MKHIVLACLFLLCGCQKKDPEGTLQPDSKGNLTVEEIRLGDSKPFRLTGGDMEAFIFSAKNGVESDMMRGCQPSMQLVKYGETDGRSLPVGDPSLGGGRVNSVRPGVYFIHLEAAQNFCSYDVSFIPAKK